MDYYKIFINRETGEFASIVRCIDSQIIGVDFSKYIVLITDEADARSKLSLIGYPTNQDFEDMINELNS